MSGQPAVLQVVILRDGLLVGTEVFVPGQYTLGSGPAVDLRLDDASVNETHAYLYFQNGRAAIQDAGSGSVFVNGHRVNACEVRAVDEIACGPFTLKVRVMAQKQQKPPPPPEVAAILGNQGQGPGAGQQQQRGSGGGSKGGTPARGQSQTPATVVSSRRMTAAPAAAEPVQARAPHLRPVPVEDSESRTESVQINAELLGPTAPARPSPAARRPQPAASLEDLMPGPAPMSAKEASDALLPAYVPGKPVSAQPAATHQRGASARAQAPTAVPAARGQVVGARLPAPSIPSAADGKGKPYLFVETYWGPIRRAVKSFSKIDPKKKLVATEDDSGALPLHGFSLGETGFVFAEQKADLFRVFVPTGADVERRAQDGNFYPVQVDTLEVGPGQRRCITLGAGHAVRFAGTDGMSLVAYVQPAIPKPFVSPLKGLPWLALASLAIFGSAFMAFILIFAQVPDSADFQAKNVNPVAVKLIAPPKPEEKKKLDEKVEKMKKPEKKKDDTPKPKEKTPPVQTASAETKKALKSVEKLAAAGPAMKDLLAAVDKLGNGPGVKGAKNDFKLSGLIGKQPIASAGIGTFGLGGGGGGGMGIKGAEILRGKGGGGIGALGAGNVGKGAVAGTVSHAASHNIGAQGSIDKEAVAKVINSHLHEVSSCYERALLKTPGLAGKIVLEWQITTSGTVGYAKTKSSSMQSAAVESCIIQVLKTWQFPPAKGSGVVITYPFMFNSVGY